MLTLPNAIAPILASFATLFTNSTWQKAQLLLVGTILTPGQRTVAAALRVMGRSNQRDYARYHEVLNRAVWSSREAARILLLLLLQYLDRGDGPLIFGIDETLERRRGAKIRARGIYRDAVRSSRHQLVKASGLRWISLMWLGPVPWAGRCGTDWAGRWSCYSAHGEPAEPRWLPHRPLVLVGDNGYAVFDLLHCCQAPCVSPSLSSPDCAWTPPSTRPHHHDSRVTNGRPALKGARRPSLKSLLDQDHVPWTVAAVAWYDGATRIVELTSQTAVWYRSGKPPVTIRWVLIRDPQGAFHPQALLCTDPAADPTQILEWFVLRWQLEVTFQEVANPSGRGNPTSVVRPGHRPHHAHPAGSLLLDRPGRPRLAKASSHHPAHRRLVRQTVADFCGRHRPGAAAPVAGLRGFFTVRSQHRPSGTPRHPVPPNGGFPRLRRLNCAKSS